MQRTSLLHPKRLALNEALVSENQKNDLVVSRSEDHNSFINACLWSKGCLIML